MTVSYKSSFWWLTLTAISSSTVAIAAVAWLIQKLLSQWFTKEMQGHTAGIQRETERFRAELGKEVEQFRQQLQHEKALEIERLRAELGRVMIEHQVRFGQLHTKQFITIARLYRLIVQTQRTMAEYFAPFVPAGAPSEAQRGKTAAVAWMSLKDFFQLHEIYFNQDTCRNMNQYLKGLQTLHIDFQKKQYAATSYVDEWNAVWEKLNVDAGALKQKLEDNFRNKIGVDS